MAKKPKRGGRRKLRCPRCNKTKFVVGQNAMQCTGCNLMLMCEDLAPAFNSAKQVGRNELVGELRCLLGLNYGSTSVTMVRDKKGKQSWSLS